MSNTLEPLIRDSVAHVGKGRPYPEVTSCPRLPVWEVANHRGLLICTRDRSGMEWVRLTDAGEALLRKTRSEAA